jgi:hypothetical protein
MARGNRSSRTRKGMILGEVDMGRVSEDWDAAGVCNPHALRGPALTAPSLAPDRSSGFARIGAADGVASGARLACPPSPAPAARRG